MLFHRLFIVISCLFFVSPLLANEPSISSHSVPTTSLEVSKTEPPFHGLQGTFDFGFPDGVSLGVAYQSSYNKYLQMFRPHLSVTYNTVSPGIRGGVTFIAPLKSRITPTLDLSAGYAFNGDANWVGNLAYAGNNNNSALKKISYAYVDLFAGINVRATRRFTIKAEAGFSYVLSTVHNIDFTYYSSKNPTEPWLIESSTSKINLFTPAVRIGFIVNLF